MEGERVPAYRHAKEVASRPGVRYGISESESKKKQFVMNQTKGSLPHRIGIWGHYHGKNLGDEVVVASLIHNIRNRRPYVEFVGISLDPEDTSRRHGISALSMVTGTRYRAGQRLNREHGAGLSRMVGAFRKTAVHPSSRTGWGMHSASALIRIWEALRDLDMVIVAGSGPLFDGWNGAWVHPFNLFKWAMVAWGTQTKFVPLSVGGGPLEASLSRFFVRHALHTAYYRSYRDPGTAELMASIGVKGHSPIFPDLGFSLPWDETERRRRNAASEETKGIVGISTVAHKDPRYQPNGDVSQYQAYLGKLVAFSSWLLDHGFRLRLLRSQVDADERVAVDLTRRLAMQGLDLEGRVMMPPTRTYQDLLDQMAQCEMVVGGRFHCHVLPFLLGKPVLGMAYHAKTFDLMAYMGQSAHCLDIDAMSVQEMIDRFQELRAQRAEAVETIERRVDVCREVLDFQYELLLMGARPAVDQNYLPTAEDPGFEPLLSPNRHVSQPQRP